MLHELVLGVSGMAQIFGIFIYYRDSKRKIRLYPLLEENHKREKELFGNISRVWERMEENENRNR